MRVVIFEASPIDPTTNLPVTIRIASGNSILPIVVDDDLFEPAITSAPTRSIEYKEDGMDVKYSSISFSVAGNEQWSNLFWDGASARAWVGEHNGSTISAFTKIFEGLLGPLQRDGLIAEVALLGNEGRLSRNLLTASYLGTGNAEGPTSLKGTLKPWTSGFCQNLEPVLIDPTYMVYQFHGYGAAQAVDAVYENALTLGSPTSVVSSYAALKSLTLAEGQWASAPDVGMFRLGASPSGKITCDVSGAKSGATFPATISAIVQHLMSVAALDSGFIDTSSIGAFSQSWNFYTTSQVQIGDVIKDAFTQANGYIFANENGVFKAGSYLSSKAPATLTTASQRVEPYVIKVSQLASPAPTYRVKIGHTKCWSTHSASEISPALAEIQDDISAATAAADAATDAANTASANATAANARLAAMADDNTLDRTDKYALITDYQKILGEQSGISTQADQYSITTEKNAYTNAISALTTYLTGLSPAYNDTTQDTTIVGTTFRSKFIDVYNARQALLNRIVTIGNLSAYLTNESAVVFADASGTVSSFSPAGGALIVNDGNVNITSGVTYSVVSSTGMTISINSSGVYSVTAMSANSATAVLRAVYLSRTFDKVFSVAKSIQGAAGANGANGTNGTNGISGYLTNEAVSLQAFADGTINNYSGASGTFKVYSGTTDISSNFSLTTLSNPQALTVSYSGQTYSVTGGLDAGEDTGTLTIRATGSGSYSGITIDKVFWVGKTKGGYEIVSSLPSTNLFIGRVVFLTLDNKLYRYTASGWSKAVDTSDLSGLISGPQLADKIITANKFAVIPTNMHPDPQFRQVSLWWHQQEGGAAAANWLGSNTTGWYVEEFNDAATTAGVNANVVGNRFITIWSGASGQDNNSRYIVYADLNRNNSFNVSQGTTYELKAGAHNNSNQSIYVDIQWFNKDFGWTGSNTIGWGAGEVSTKSAQFTPPSGATFGRVAIYNHGQIYGQPTYSGWTRVSNISVREAGGATLFVDGSITTPKLATSSVTADKIAAGIINAAHLATTTLITTSAQIGNLIVDTIHVKNGAISRANVATKSTHSWSGSGTSDVVSVTITPNSSNSLLAISGSFATPVFGGSTANINYLVSNVSYGAAGITYQTATSTTTFNGVALSISGTTTFTFRVQSPSGGSNIVSDVVLNVMEFMK